MGKNMNLEQLNEIALQIARQQRIDADDRALRLAVDLEIANRKILELQKLLSPHEAVPQKETLK